jgi:HK97 family phage portal protein
MVRPFTLPWRRRRADAVAHAQQAVEQKSAALNGGFVALHHAGAASWSPRSYAALAREGYMKNPVAHRCVRMIAEAAAAVPLLLYEGEREHDQHPMLQLLTRPNPQESGAVFFEGVYGELLLSGNAYVEAVSTGGTIRELYRHRPDLVRASVDADGWVTSHELSLRGRIRRIPSGSAADGGLMHLKLFHPIDQQVGFAPLEAAQMALDLHNASSTWNKALLDNSARPSGALVYQPKDGGNLTEDQYARLKVELEDGYSGANRAGRPMLLEGGLDWKTMALSPREMDFVEARNGAARDIALALGVPPMLLGIPGDNTYANYQEANRAFLRLTVLPLIARACAAFTHWLAPAYGAALRLDFDADRIEGLSVEREALWARLEAASFLSDDEKRKAVGYEPLAR